MSHARRASTFNGVKRPEASPKPSTSKIPDTISDEEDDDDETLHCAICLSVIEDRTVCDPCQHDAYCFSCILAWTETSRRCPLCTRQIQLLVHSIRSERDFQRYYLPPLPDKDDSASISRNASGLREGARRQLYDRPTHPRFKYADWRERNRATELSEAEAELLALQKRKYVYRHNLFVKHVASNRFTRYRDHTAQQIQASAELKQRLTHWVRRELRVFGNVDSEFLTGYIVSIASQLELRSDSASRLLAEFLGDAQSEHFLHETYNFLRSPYKDLRHYDSRPVCTQDARPNGKPRRKSETVPQDARKYRPRSPSPPGIDDRRRNSRSETSDLKQHNRADRSARIPSARGQIGSELTREDTICAAMPNVVDSHQTALLTAATESEPSLPSPMQDSDIEDIISLGDESDKSESDVRALRAKKLRRTEPAPAKVALAILGAAERRQNIENKQGTPSNPRATRSSEVPTELSTPSVAVASTFSTPRTVTAAVDPVHRGSVDVDLRKRFMRKLEEAKLVAQKHDAASVAAANGNPEHEQRLKASVMAMRASRLSAPLRSTPAFSSKEDADTPMRVHSASPIVALLNDEHLDLANARRASLTERIAKEKKQVELRNRLSAAKASISPGNPA